MLLLLLLLPLLYCQPCFDPINLVTSPIQGSCGSASSDTHQFTATQLGNIDGMKEFTIGVWFKVASKAAGAQIASLFRLSLNPSDTTGATGDGIRVALLVSTSSDTTPFIRLQYAKLPGTFAQTRQSNFNYQLEKWIWAAVSVSYSQVIHNKYLKGLINYYAWQPSFATLRITQAPFNEGVDFNTALTQASTVVNVLYWGSYTSFCGTVDKVTWYAHYFEGDHTHNWLNIPFWTDGATFYTPRALYKLEDQVGQVAVNYLDQTQNGFLGFSGGLDLSTDPAFHVDGYLDLQSGQYLTMHPFVWMDDSRQIGLSFWFRTNADILADADFTDSDLDLNLFRRVFKGTSDSLVLMLQKAPANTFILKLKIQGIIYRANTLTININTWYFLSVRVAYPGSIRELGRILFDVILNTQTYSHEATPQADLWQESSADKVYLGDGRNSFTGNVRLAHVYFFSWYSAYVKAAGVGCQSNCLVSINSQEVNECLQCKTGDFLQFPGQMCGSQCLDGRSGTKHTQIPVCKTCDYKCATCNVAGNCFSCNAGYYLSGVTCVLATGCGVGFKADAETQTCSKCGNGTKDAGEGCDDGNILPNDGCYKCQVEVGYVCDLSNPSVCELQCGNGTIELGEQCDDKNLRQYDGCYKCEIEQGFECTGQPSKCQYLCGNGKRVGDEECDDGNYVSGDGCSMSCQVEYGFVCSGGTPVSKDTCNPLCGNNILNVGEECDDGNGKKNDGCYNCKIEFGWSCTGGICKVACGNGFKEQWEDCDDGNATNGDGCTNCFIDQDYVCSGGTLSQADTCVLLTDICGDGYKKTTEQCEDGNDTPGDGCSQLCQIELGYKCFNGLLPYYPQVCSPICGDKLIKGDETCDDGNTVDGDGCSSKCQLEGSEKYCGNGYREINEECDDGNNLPGDGCSPDCLIELQWSCTLVIGGNRDICSQCIYQCSTCTNSTLAGCTRCYQGYMKHEPTQRCEPQCPKGYFGGDLECSICPDGCSGCVDRTLCTECDNRHYFLGGKCLESCSEGYFNQLNAIFGNTCQKCFSPCLICKNEIVCEKCDDFYYVGEEGMCQKCEMGDKCIRCNKEDDECTQCVKGYFPRGNSCEPIPSVCGDGLHHLSELCDDGNLDKGDGCDHRCTVEVGFNCILEDNHGPDVCYKLEPVSIEPYIDQVHFDQLFLHFTRPLKEALDFTPLLTINLPDVNGYKYVLTLEDPSLLVVTFEFNETVRNSMAYLNFSQPHKVVDKFGWSMVAQVDDPLAKEKAKEIMSTPLNYYIYYDDEERDFADTLGIIVLSFACISLAGSVLFVWKDGDGRMWKIVESMQVIAMLRFVNLRYSLHLHKVFWYLHSFSLAFIPNIFAETGYDYSQQLKLAPPKFQIDDYAPLFMIEGGGRLISLLIYFLGFFLVVIILAKVVTWEPMLNVLEDIIEYFKFQAFIRLFEVLFLDVMMSSVLTFYCLELEDSMQQASFAFAIIFILAYVVLTVLEIKFIITPDDAVTHEWIHKRVACIYDGHNMRTKAGRIYMLFGYIQKWATVIVLITTQDPIIQISIMAVLRFLPIIPFVKINPFTHNLIRIREVLTELWNIAVILATIIFRDNNAPKDLKVQQGWLVALALLLNTIHWSGWCVIFVVKGNKLKAPDYLVEENDVYKHEEVPQHSNHELDKTPEEAPKEEKAKEKEKDKEKDQKNHLKQPQPKMKNNQITPAPDEGALLDDPYQRDLKAKKEARKQELMKQLEQRKKAAQEQQAEEEIDFFGS